MLEPNYCNILGVDSDEKIGFKCGICLKFIEFPNLETPDNMSPEEVERMCEKNAENAKETKRIRQCSSDHCDHWIGICDSCRGMKSFEYEIVTCGCCWDKELAVMKEEFGKTEENCGEDDEEDSRPY